MEMSGQLHAPAALPPGMKDGTQRTGSEYEYFIGNKGKGKVVPLQARCGPEGG